MITKALNSKQVKSIAIAKGWKRKKSLEVLGYGRELVLVNETLSNKEGTSILNQFQQDNPVLSYNPSQ